MEPCCKLFGGTITRNELARNEVNRGSIADGEIAAGRERGKTVENVYFSFAAKRHTQVKLNTENTILRPFL